MLVNVTLLDGTEISPIFDPEHKELVIVVYQKQYWTSSIRGYKVTFDDGTGFSVGCYLAEKMAI